MPPSSRAELYGQLIMSSPSSINTAAYLTGLTTRLYDLDKINLYRQSLSSETQKIISLFAEEVVQKFPVLDNLAWLSLLKRVFDKVALFADITAELVIYIYETFSAISSKITDWKQMNMVSQNLSDLGMQLPYDLLLLGAKTCPRWNSEDIRTIGENFEKMSTDKLNLQIIVGENDNMAMIAKKLKLPCESQRQKEYWESQTYSKNSIAEHSTATLWIEKFILH